MTFEYDEEVDALFIWFSESKELTEGIIAGEIWPSEAKEHIGLLFNDNNKLIGLEILFASAYLDIDYIKLMSSK